MVPSLPPFSVVVAGAPYCTPVKEREGAPSSFPRTPSPFLIIFPYLIWSRVTRGKHFKLSAPQDSGLIAILEKKGVDIHAEPPRSMSWYMSLLVSLNRIMCGNVVIGFKVTVSFEPLLDSLQVFMNLRLFTAFGVGPSRMS